MHYVNITSLYEYEPGRKEWPDITSMQNIRLSFSLFLSGRTTFVSDGRLAFPRSTWLSSIEFPLSAGFLPSRKLGRGRERHITERISPSRGAVYDRIDTHQCSFPAFPKHVNRMNQVITAHIRCTYTMLLFLI